MCAVDVQPEATKKRRICIIYYYYIYSSFKRIALSIILVYIECGIDKVYSSSNYTTQQPIFGAQCGLIAALFTHGYNMTHIELLCFGPNKESVYYVFVCNKTHTHTPHFFNAY